MLLRTTLLVYFAFVGVNSFEVKVDTKNVKDQVNSDQDVQESGFLSDHVDKEEYRKDVNDYGYSRDVPYDKERGVTYKDFIDKNNKGYYDDKDSNNYDKLEYRHDFGKPFDKRTIRKLDKIFGFTGPTANDEPENLIRPCSLQDWQCIRKYFEANGQCKASYGPIPDPFYIEKNTIFFSAVNVTANFLNFEIRGLSSAKINDFYVNKKSGNLVFAIDVQNLNITSPRVYVRFRRTAKESIVLADSAFVLFRSATFTAVLSKIPKLTLDNADIHVDVDDSRPAFAFGPAIYNSTDLDVIDANAQFFILLPILVREGLTFLAPLITGIYIQENICRFGTKLISL